jgi:hypothetical protein
MDVFKYDVEPQFFITFAPTFGIVACNQCAIDGWLGFNHVVILKTNGHKTCGNFQFVQK